VREQREQFVSVPLTIACILVTPCFYVCMRDHIPPSFSNPFTFNLTLGFENGTDFQQQKRTAMRIFCARGERKGYRTNSPVRYIWPRADMSTSAYLPGGFPQWIPALQALGQPKKRRRSRYLRRRTHQKTSAGRILYWQAAQPVFDGQAADYY